MKDVEGKVAFITGGSSGIGLGIARALVDAGMKVALGYRSRDHLDSAMKVLKSAEDRVQATYVDVTDRAGVARAAAEAIKSFGRIHVLVNNAGIFVDTPLIRTSYKEWDQIINVNLNGVFNGVHEILPHIQAHGEGGHIIATSSIYGLVAGTYAYSVSKFAVVGFMEDLRRELAGSSIGVSVCCPGLVNTNLFDAGNSGSSGAIESHGGDRQVGVPQYVQWGMDPFEVGRIVLRGMRSNDLYILTHPEYGEIIEARNQALMASIPKDLQATSARISRARSDLRDSIYIVERDRKRCAAAKHGVKTR